MTLVTVTVLRYVPRRYYRAFADMGRWMMRPFDTPGLRFQKMLGSGKNFGVIPDFSQYVFLAVWDSEDVASQFFASERWREHVAPTTETGTLWLQPTQAHGMWDGVNPFLGSGLRAEGIEHSAKNNPFALSSPPVAVLTRATIRTGALLDFWRHVPQARQRLRDAGESLLFALGVGEKPLVQQCTLSVWRDVAAVEQFAYKQAGHREIVRMTRQRKWYSEELFARFNVLRAEGDVFSTLRLRESPADAL